MSKISTYEVAPVPKLSDKLIGTSVGGEIEDITYNFTLLELLELFLPVIPANNLQGVLDYGNTATQDINLFGTITTTNLDVTDTANLFITYLNEETHIVGSLFDSVDSIGTAGQVLTSTGDGVEWFTLPPIFTPNLQQVLTEGNTADIDIILDANIEALDVTADTIEALSNITIGGTLTDGAASIGAAGKVLGSTGAGVQWVDFPSYSATSPLFLNAGTGVFSIQVANSTQGGYLTANDWVTFDGKQNAGNYITALTGEATANGPGSVPITLNNASVIAKVLTGLNITGGSISASDSILTAFGKVQNQINGLIGGVQYKGTWDAATNTPVLVSSVGVQGNYYIVSVAGNTDLNGITDWKVGDWAIFSDSSWQKVDNTESVTSVNGQVGAVSLTTDNIPEGTTNLYYLNSRARAALSFVAGSGAYNNTTGVITIPTDNSQILNGAGYITLSSLSASAPLSYNNLTGVFSIPQAAILQDGYLSATDWATFNNKQNYLGGTGLVKSSAGTITYITDNSGNWNTAYNDSIVSAAVTGTATKTLTLNQQDGGTIQASWTDLDTGLTSVGVTMPSAFNVANSPLTANGTIGITGAGTSLQYIDGTGALQTFPGLTGFVPYIGANNNVDLGEYGISAGYFQADLTPTGALQVGRMQWNPIEGTMDLRLMGNNVTLQVGQENVTRVVNKTGIDLMEANYQVVRVRKTAEGGAQGQRLAVLLAQGNNENNSTEVLGLVTETILVNQEGFVTSFGEVKNINTTGSLQSETWVDGDILYVSPTIPGQLTNIRPTAPNHAVTVGYVTYAHANNGKIYMAIDTGYELGELHNVYAPNPTANQSIYWNIANSRYELNTIGGILGYTPANAATTLTINGITYDLSANRTWSVGTVTSVAALTLGTAGSDLSSTVANGTTTPVITLNVPTASAANRGALSAADWSTFNTKVGGVTASSPLFSSGGSTPNITIQQSSGSQDGYLSAADWSTFNNKQAAGNYITSLTGEATASGPGAAAVTLNNASVTAKVLTGINITGGTVQATDTMLTAFGKLQNQINGLIGSTIYQGTWNASTNTPALASGVGVRGYYYIVSVAGNTNLDGITDWFIGDWAIFDGTAWQQVDNTDAVVSVNGQTGAVSLTTDNIPEGATNQYFTTARARASLSFAAGSGAYNSSTGVITIPTNTNQLTNGASFITLASLSGVAPIQYNNSTGAISITQASSSTNGFLSSTDWNTFNNKQPAGSYVPTSRTLTINGVGYDLSADRTWTITNISGSSKALSATDDSITTQGGNGNVIYGYAIPLTTTGLFPAGDNSNSVLTINRHPDNYYSQLGFSSNGNMYYRSFSGTPINNTAPWRTVWDSGTLTNLNQLINGPGYVTGGPYLPLSGGTLTGFLSGTGASFSGNVNWQGINSGNPRSLAIGYSGGSYGQAGYGITFTSGGAFNYAINDIVSMWEAYDGLKVYAAGAGSVGTPISWTTVLDARRSTFTWMNNTVLHSSNYNSYSPTLTGVGASGTWGINITGNSATATNVTNLGTAFVTTGEQFTPTTLLGVYSNGYVYKFSLAGVQSWLGLGSYLPLTGGVMTGNIQYSKTNGEDWYIESNACYNGPWIRFRPNTSAAGFANRSGALGFIDGACVRTTVLQWDDSAMQVYVPFTGTTINASSFNGNVVVASATVGGQVKFNYASASSASRSWIAVSDTYNYGDFGIQQSTTQTGTTYVNRLIIGANGSLTVGSVTGTGSGSLFAGATTLTGALVGTTAGFSGQISTSNGVDTDILINITVVGAGTKYASIQSSVANRNLVLNPTNNGNLGVGLTAPKVRTHVLGLAGGQAGAGEYAGDSNYYGGGRAAIYQSYYGDEYGNGAPYGASSGAQPPYSVWYGGGAGGYFRGGNGDPSPGGGGAGIVAIGGNGSTYAAGGAPYAEGGAGIYARGGFNRDGATRTWAGYFEGAVFIRATDVSGNRISPFNVLTISAENPNAPYNAFGGSILFNNRSYTHGVVSSSRIRSVIYDDGSNQGGGFIFETTPTAGGSLTNSFELSYTGAATFAASVTATNYSTPALSLTPSIDLLYNSSTAGLKIWYNAANAISFIDNYYHNTVNGLPYGDIQIRTKISGINTLATALTIKGYTGDAIFSSSATANTHFSAPSFFNGLSYPYNTLFGSGADVTNTKIRAGSTTGYESYVSMQSNILRFGTGSVERMYISNSFMDIYNPLYVYGNTYISAANNTIGNDGGAQKKFVSIGLNSADYQHRYILLAKVPTFGAATVNAGFRGTIVMERVNGIGIDLHDDFDLTVSYNNAIEFRQTSYQAYQTSLVQLSYGGVQYLALYVYSAPGYAIAYIDAIQTNYGGWLDGNTFLAIQSGSSLHSSISYSSNTTVFKQAINVYGSVTATSFFESSDSRIKQLIKNDYKVLGIDSVKARLYIKDGKEEIGYYAQDVQGVLPCAVNKNDAGFLSLSYTQVHTAKIAIIEDEVTILKRRVAELESKIN